MIGIFDSGFGGLTILKKVIELLPEHSYIYLGDNMRAPYGPRSEEEIFTFTVQGVEELFSRGAKLIILACNTSSAVALRKIQQEILPIKYPDKRVLGIIIPTAEESDKFSQTKHISIWATEATVDSQVYVSEMLKIDSEFKITQLPCPILVPLIEAGNTEEEELTQAIKSYIKILQSNDQIDTLILGCTHYAIIEDEIRNLLPSNIKLITQGDIIAEKLKQYLLKHTEIYTSLRKQSERIFLTTASDEKIKKVACLFYGKPVDLKVITLTSTKYEF